MRVCYSLLCIRRAARQGAPADVAQRIPIDLGSLRTWGASATVGGLRHAAERPIRWAADALPTPGR